MLVSLSDEIEIKSVPASEAWELYSTLAYARIIVELDPQLFDRIEVLEGNNGKAGTVLLIYFKPSGEFPITPMKEKYTVVDDEKRVKVAEMMEGWFFECGVISMRSKFEITEKPKKNGEEEEEEESCILKYGIELEAKDWTVVMGAMNSFKHLESINKAISGHLIANRKKCT